MPAASNQTPSPAPTSVSGLLAAVADLPPSQRETFNRLFRVTASTGTLTPPKEMEPWIIERFGSVDAVVRQEVVRISNLVTLEAALFNPLRAKRPIEARGNSDLDARIEAGVGGSLCNVETETPADDFGRLRGRYCITAAQIAKFAAHHSLIIFDHHSPLELDAEMVADYIDTGYRWAEAAHAGAEEARYFFFLWNSLWRAGASLVHGHAQVVLGRGMHFARVEYLRRCVVGYREGFARSYFDDLFEAHESIGAGFRLGDVRVMAHLTPLKENELLLVADAMSAEFQHTIGKVQTTYLSALGVESFNLAIQAPPLWKSDEDWSGFPVVVRMIDRGGAGTVTSDFGTMELYATSVVSSDPIETAAILRERLT